MAARLTAFVVVGIVAVTLIAGLIVGAQRDESDGPIDLIVHNGRVYAAGRMAEAVAVRGNQIVRVGSNRDLLRLRRPQTQVIDARGAAVLPGFNDAHVHLIEGGLSLNNLDLSGVASAEDVQRQIADWASVNSERTWILGRGWDYRMFPGALPTRQLLDAVAADRPALILSADGHTAWVNTKALRVARITPQTPDPRGGAIVRDPRTGDPSGVLKEAAIDLVRRHAPAPTTDDRGRALRAAINEAHRHGVTSVQVPGASVEDLELYDEATRQGELQLRLYAAIASDGALEPALDRLEGLRAKYGDSPVFKAAALKLRLDGIVETHTAAMLDPYANRADAGTPMIAADDLDRVVRLADARGWQIATHAVGDRAVRMALDAYARAERSNPAPTRGRRHRIEHVETLDRADVGRFGALGVIASMQPFRGSMIGDGGLWARNLGEERAARGRPFVQIAEGGGRLAFGSDWPAAPLDPMLGIRAAAGRPAEPGTRAGGRSVQHLPLRPAIDAYTSGGAWASFDEQRKGTLEAGMLADIVILTHDLFDSDPQESAAARAAVTIFDGKVVFRRDRSGSN